MDILENSRDEKSAQEEYDTTPELRELLRKAAASARSTRRRVRLEP